MFDTIFFDLDGTLTDSAPGILNGVRFALEGAGIAVPPEQELMRFIGPPLTTELQAAFGVGAEEAAGLVRRFQVYFQKDGMFENRVYDGVPEMLEGVLSLGLRTAVTTSKPEPFAKTILDHFGLSKYFTMIVGSDLDEKTRATKAEVVARALEILAPARALLVGDRCYDVEGAHANGIPCLGVLYGYGSREELSEAEYIAGTVEDIPDTLARLTGKAE